MVTDLCVMKPDAETKEFVVTALHPGITPEQVRQNTGWSVRFADELEETTAPDPLELEILRELNARTERAHGHTATAQ
jgi:glutaconate CoA-transferase subunit B